MTIPRVVLSNSRLDVRQDRTLALKSLLVELGLISAESLVDTMNSIVLDNNFYAFLRLPTYLKHPTLSICCHLFTYLYGFIPRQALIQSAINSAPYYSSGVSALLDQLIKTDFTNYSDLLDALEVSGLDVFDLIQHPAGLPNWIASNWAEFEPFSISLKDKDTAAVILSILSLDPSLRLQFTDNLTKEVSYWSDIAFKQQVFGSDYTL